MSMFYIHLFTYTIYGFFLLAGTTVMYRTFSTAEDRKLHRLQVVGAFEKTKKKAQVKLSDESFQNRLYQAGIHFLSPYNYELIRFTVGFTLLILLIPVPMLLGNAFNPYMLYVVTGYFIVTEHRLSIKGIQWLSIINVLINTLIKQQQRKKEIEIFTLYDLLKADIFTFDQGQEINLYNLLKDRIDQFQYIKRPLSRFLNLWMTDPDTAKNAFYDDLRTQGAKTLGEVLAKIDSASREEALNIVTNESEVYNNQFYKKEMELQFKRKNYVMILFGITVFVLILWLLMIFSTVTLIQLENDMLLN